MEIKAPNLAFAGAQPVIAPQARKATISIVGLGYVGAVSTACLSSLGHPVIGVDVDAHKIANIAAGKSPIHEKDLDRLLEEGLSAKRIRTTYDLAWAVRISDITFVSVGTPTSEDGGCDYSYIEAAAADMARGLANKSDFHVFVMRCSIPPGTTMRVMTPLLEQLSGKKLGIDFGVCFNPEFLREGVAVDDFYNPPKIVIGTTCDRTAKIMREVYTPIDDQPITTSIEAAEMVKYVDNVWHATKVTFANEVGRLCKSQGVDSHDVMDIFVQDTKLNLSPYYLKPGFAYGGSCLPKEVRAVAYIAQTAGIDLPLIQNLDRSNKAHIEETIRMARETGAKRVGVLGLAFKPGTDDLRESPILEVIAALREDGVEVEIHDQAITTHTPLDGQLAYVRHGSPGLQALAPELAGMLRDDPSDVVENADAIIVTHRHPEYVACVSWAEPKPVIDVVRFLDQDQRKPGYIGIGW